MKREELIEARDDFEGLLAELDALRAYADHRRTCEYALGIGGQFNRCTCGLDAARQRWSKPHPSDADRPGEASK